MSKLKATVLDIESFESLHLVRFNLNDQIITMMGLELNDKIKPGVKVCLSIKPSHVAIAKDLNGILSYSNQLNCKVRSITNGKLLSSIDLEFLNSNHQIEAIITKNSVKKMDLKENDLVTVLIKASEVSIMDIYDD